MSMEERVLYAKYVGDVSLDEFPECTVRVEVPLGQISHEIWNYLADMYHQNPVQGYNSVRVNADDLIVEGGISDLMERFPDYSRVWDKLERVIFANRTAKLEIDRDFSPD